MNEDEVTFQGVAHLPGSHPGDQEWTLPEGAVPLTVNFGQVVGRATLSRGEGGAILVTGMLIDSVEVSATWLKDHRYAALGVTHPLDHGNVVSVSLARENVDPDVPPLDVTWRRRDDDVEDEQ